MRLDKTIYDMARQLADEAECPVNDIVELCVKTVYLNVMLGGLSTEQLKSMVRKSRGATQAAKGLSGTPDRSRPKKQGPLKHSPFESLKDLK
jgi:hypothetical protein